MKKNIVSLIKEHKVTLGTPGEIDGGYLFRHPKIKGYYFQVIASDGMGWDHISVVIIDQKRRFIKRCPTWPEMCYIKDIFFDPEEVAVQYHPHKDAYVNNHPFCLHLWRPQAEKMPLPLKQMI